MMFVLRMAWRETRASWFRLLFFFLCVALGVAAIVVLRSIIQNVRHTLVSEARVMVGADVVVQMSGRPSPALSAAVASVEQTTGILGHSSVVETQTMASAAEGRGNGRVRLVEIRAVEAAFPYYGTLELADGRTYSHDLVADHGALVTPEFLAEMGLGVGDDVRLAGELFRIRGAVVRDRIQRGGLSFGPRVYVDLGDLERTSLLGFGSRASYQTWFRVDAGALDAVTRALRLAVEGQPASVRSWRSLEDRLGRNLTIAENYLSLVGFAMVVLGGIGVWSVTRVVVQQKIKSVAILKCVGATSGRVLGVYVLQVVWLAAGGSLLGLALAVGVAGVIPASVLAPLGVTRVVVTLSAAAQGVAVGILVSLLFALVPLLEMRKIKPLLLLRADTAGSARARDWTSRLSWVGMSAALAVVAMWQADSVRAGLYVSLGLGVVAAVLFGAGRVLVRAVEPLTRSRHFAVRHAVISLGRPGNQTRVILMAVGLGCFFILAVRAIQVNLLAEFTGQIGRNAPDFVLIDIQPDQVDGVRETVAPYLRGEPRLMPMMRARVVSVEGRQVNLPDVEAVRKHDGLGREFGLTYRDSLQENEQLVAGRFWSAPLTTAALADGADTEVSVEEQMHDETRVDVGDLMRFEIGGVRLTARVTSIRRVTWSDFQNGGFVFVLRPGPAVSRVPSSDIGFLSVREDPAARGALQRDLVRRYPNVSAIDVSEVMASLRKVIDNVTVGVTVVGAVTLVGGVLILIGAVAMTKFQRLYEAAIYRTLGAGTRLLAEMVVVEYGLLGLLAGVLGAFGAFGLSWVLARFLFDIEWRPTPGLLGGGALLTAAAVGLVGLAASLDVLVTKPLATLRSE
jgi:putative ABC transport system permease protein